jgi:hypothetical protein
MSDENPTPVANATVALAIQTLNDEVGAVKRQVKNLWIAVVVALVLVVILAGFTILPRFFGIGMMGGFRRGQFQGRTGGFPPGTQQPGQQPGTQQPGQPGTNQ